MADVRSLLKSERAARRIQHKYASYSTTGTLLCVVCHLQLKSESLWEGHLRSAGHIVRLQKLQEVQGAEPVAATEATANGDINGRKRKAARDEDDDEVVPREIGASNEEDEEPLRKRTKATSGEISLDSLHSYDLPPPPKPPIPPPNEMRIPSRPATPLKPVEEVPKKADVDEDEWAAFEADIAAAEAPAEAVISAPAISAAELAAQSTTESNVTRKERQEAEMEADKEDAARKLEEEFEEMQSLEARVSRMKEKREILRKKESMIQPAEKPVTAVPNANALEEEEDEDEEGDEDDWTTFRTSG